MPSSDIKGGYCSVPGTAPIRSEDTAGASRAQWLANHVVTQCPIQWRWLQTYVIDWQPKAAIVSRWQRICVHHTICAAFYDRTLSFANGHYFLKVHGRSVSVSDRYGITDSEAADFTGSVRSNFGWIVRPFVDSDFTKKLYICYILCEETMISVLTMRSGIQVCDLSLYQSSGQVDRQFNHTL